MLGGINTQKVNMKTLKSRRAMLDTLMRHLDMVRLSAGVTAAFLMGCTGLISGADPGGAGTLTPEEQVAIAKFQSGAYPVFKQVCAACHAGTDPANAFIQVPAGTAADDASTAAAMRKTLLAYTPGVVNLDAPESSRVVTKGAHSGPALDATQSSGILAWLQAEKDASKTSTTTVEITTGKFSVLLCTSGVAGDPTCPINRVQLDNVGLVGAEIYFIAQPLSSDIYISDLYAKASTAGLYIEHPLFVSWPQTGNPIPDTIDRFFAVKLNLAATATAATCPGPSCDHIGAGAAAFVGFPPQNQISITFKVLDPFHTDAAPPPPPTGCGTMGFASFLSSAKPQLTTCQTMCHGGGQAGAKNAMDLSGLASTTDNNACLQVRSHVNFQTVASSGILLAPQPGSADTAHPFKLGAGTPITTFQTALNTWITVDATGQ